ncbi:MAG: histidine phosphatase family protein [Rhodobacteraceae bacterium]|nr:histidine phosphatase family protein [Paracoccaceae bacterium]
MTLRLILTRHAKSNWDNPALEDHDRPLSRRGRASATAIGGWLADRNYSPDQVLCSSAARTQETWARIAAKLPAAPDPAILVALYLADPGEMLGELGGANGQCVMLIAHNPGSAWLAQGLARSAPPDTRFQNYPTAATTIFDFETDRWAEIEKGSGKVVDFVVPRDLL